MRSVRKQIQKAFRKDIKDGLVDVKGVAKDYRVVQVL